MGPSASGSLTSTKKRRTASDKVLPPTIRHQVGGERHLKAAHSLRITENKQQRLNVEGVVLVANSVVTTFRGATRVSKEGKEGEGWRVGGGAAHRR